MLNLYQCPDGSIYTGFSPQNPRDRVTSVEEWRARRGSAMDMRAHAGNDAPALSQETSVSVNDARNLELETLRTLSKARELEKQMDALLLKAEDDKFTALAAEKVTAAHRAELVDCLGVKMPRGEYEDLRAEDQRTQERLAAAAERPSAEAVAAGIALFDREVDAYVAAHPGVDGYTAAQIVLQADPKRWEGIR